MKTFKQFSEAEDHKITKQDLNALEKGLDKLYAKNDIDFEFTRHFLDRVNDPRNHKQISIQELVHLFVEFQKKHGHKLKHSEGLEAVMKDFSSDVNTPFVMNFNPKTGMMELVAKTVMRKKDFKTGSSRVFRVT